MLIDGIPLPEVQGEYWKDNYVYVLRLQDDCWYVGQTYKLATRLRGHFGAGGAIWTRAHKPIEVVELHWGNKHLENMKTLEYMAKYGIDKVRGGRWCPLVLPTKMLDSLIPKVHSYGRSDACNQAHPSLLSGHE